ncbi:MAG: DUF2586 domain-containing protein, partial [Hungatella sp.]
KSTDQQYQTFALPPSPEKRCSMALRDVNAVIEDGALGIVEGSGSGVHVKIGISNVSATVPVLITGSMKPDKIKEKLGFSPLADAVIDAVENGAGEIYCVPIASSADGTISDVEHAGSGDGTISVSGKPENSFDVMIKIMEAGGLNKASFCYSINGGYSYGEELTVPLGGSYILPNTGITLVFGVAAEAVFVTDAWYRFSTTSPTTSNGTILQAVESLYNFSTKFEFIHIVGASDQALWAALAQVADEFLTVYKNPIFFLCEGRYIKKDEKLDEYTRELIGSAKGVNSYFIQVCSAYAEYTRWDGRTQLINAAGIVSGLYGLTKESESIGKVRSYSISEVKMKRLMPEGIEDFISVLDDAKYLTFRRYIGLSGFYVNNAKMMCQEGSDYRYAEFVRVVNRLVKDVSSAAVKNIQMDINADDPEADIAQITEDLNTPVEAMVDKNIISSGNVVIDIADLNILVDESLNVSITFVPRGYTRQFNLNFAMVNPYRN